MSIIANLLKGIAVGLANIIPGVSGGTMLLVLGIYERVIKALHNLGPKTVTAVFRGWRALRHELQRLDALFVGSLVAGAALAVVGVAKLMVYLINQHHDPTYGFFFGLVLVSVIVPYRMIKRRNLTVAIAGLAGIVAVVGLTFALSGEQRLASERQKQAIKAARASATATTSVGSETGTDTATGSAPLEGGKLVLFFVAGAVAVAAMILPGISGSFMLLMMGVYFDLLAAINALDLPLLGVFMVGCVIGLLAFTRLLNYLLDRHHDATMAFLLGLVVGSLWAIWPFKSFAMAGPVRVDLYNVLPAGFGFNEVLTVLAMLAGCAVVATFIWIEQRQQHKGQPG